MPRFFVEKKNIFNDTAIIAGEEARHITKVLRLSKGDLITLFDREGNFYKGIIVDKTTKSVKIRIIKIIKNWKGVSEYNIIVAQAVLKGKKMDLVIQKSCELGVSGIIPFFSSRTVPKWDVEGVNSKLKHWKRIITESIKQSGVRPSPFIETPIMFRDLIKKKFPSFLKIILWEEEKEVVLKKILSEKGNLQNIIFVVGPEGGFSDEEIEIAKKEEFICCGLGEFILRAETVSICVLSIIQYEMGWFG